MNMMIKKDKLEELEAYQASCKNEMIKCERCGRIKPVFQWTYWEEDKFLVALNGTSKNISERKGLCEECGIEINKKKYDEKNKI
jgi:hypothetical protein